MRSRRRRGLSGSWVTDERSAIGAGFAAMTGVTSVAERLTQGAAPPAPAPIATRSTCSRRTRTYFADAIVKRVYFPSKIGVMPAWYVELDVANADTADSSVYSFVFDAVGGAEALHEQH